MVKGVDVFADGLDIRQKQLARLCLWDDEAQTLWIDARKLYPKLGVVPIISWDKVLFSSEPVPNYPKNWQIMQWQNLPAIQDWRKQIPSWVQESIALFPTHQLKLLHYVGRFPQLLELLDHSPMLAWRLMDADLSEQEIVALLNQKRTEIVGLVGWPGKAETVKFLRNLRLRLVNPQIAEQIETCLLDETRLNAMQALPRINSMALSLAARFPEMIGCRLHQSLAAMPCRPMQCQSMIALLEDVYRLADYQGWSDEAKAEVSDCRYLIEVEQIYETHLALFETPDIALKLNETPSLLSSAEEWLALSIKQGHYWLTDIKQGLQLYGMQAGESVLAFLWDDTQQQLLRVRQSSAEQKNLLPTAEQLSQIHLFLSNISNKSL